MNLGRQIIGLWLYCSPDKSELLGSGHFSYLLALWFILLGPQSHPTWGECGVTLDISPVLWVPTTIKKKILRRSKQVQGKMQTLQMWYQKHVRRKCKPLWTFSYIVTPVAQGSKIPRLLQCILNVLSSFFIPVPSGQTPRGLFSVPWRGSISHRKQSWHTVVSVTSPWNRYSVTHWRSDHPSLVVH